MATSAYRGASRSHACATSYRQQSTSFTKLGSRHSLAYGRRAGAIAILSLPEGRITLAIQPNYPLLSREPKLEGVDQNVEV